MGESKRYFEHIKKDFVNNKAKFAVLFLAIALWVFGEVNPASEHTGHPFRDVFSIVMMFTGAFTLFSFFDVIGFVKKHSTATLIFWIVLFLLIVAYKKAKPDYPVENDVVLLTVMIYGTLPYAVEGKKTVGVILGALITAIGVAVLAVQELWWSADVFLLAALVMQMYIAILDVFGGRKLIRLAEVYILNVLFVFGALFLMFNKIPHIPPVHIQLNSVEQIARAILITFICIAIFCVLKYENKNFYAMCALVAIVAQTTFFEFAKSAFESSYYLGIPFAQSDVLNRLFAMPLAVGIILAPPAIDNPLTLKKIFK